ncbi:MAG: thioredoxin family protein [Byssovorax sp.]
MSLLRRLILLSACALALPACKKDAPEPSKEEGAPAEVDLHLGPRADAEWNGGAIAWQPIDEGLRRAKAENKPVCLVFHADWCPHCKSYSHVFDDPKVVEKARDFVMILVNADEDNATNKRYAPDGSYLPRTMFLAPDGTLAREIHATRDRYLYFFDERNPASLLGGMKEAKDKLAGR